MIVLSGKKIPDYCGEPFDTVKLLHVLSEPVEYFRGDVLHI